MSHVPKAPPPPKAKDPRRMYRPPVPKLRKSMSFEPDLSSIRQQLGLSVSDFSALRRALHDAETGKHKLDSQHEEDESWIDWALKTAKRYGPQLAELMLAA